MTQNSQQEVTFWKAFVNAAGQVSGGMYTPSTSVAGTVLVAQVSSRHLEPHIPQNTVCTFDPANSDVPVGSLVIATVTLHTPPLRTGKRRLAKLATVLAIKGLPLPEVEDKTFRVIRWLRRDADGVLQLHAAEGQPIVASQETSIEILGLARPDLERNARSAEARESRARTLGYRRPTPLSSQGTVHLALQRLRDEERSDPDAIPQLARNLLADPQLRILHAFRQAESEFSYGTTEPVYPIDRLCARLFRAGQLSWSLQREQAVSASFTLLDAEEILNQVSLPELIEGLTASSQYFEVIRQYSSAETAMVWIDGSTLTMPVLAARMFRAGQLSLEAGSYAKAA